jgi:hypothetical protein
MQGIEDLTKDELIALVDYMQTRNDWLLEKLMKARDRVEELEKKFIGTDWR